MSKNHTASAGPSPEFLEMLKLIEPIQLFDDYYFVGCRLVGFHILKTSEGLVLFDSGDDWESAWERILLPGLKKLGLEKEKLCMLLLTHGHFDHYLGAVDVQKKTGVTVALSERDTGYMLWADENMPPKPQAVPRITRILTPGEKLTFGDHTVEVLDGAGHTPGCLNYAYTVHDKGVPHTAVMMGGYGVFGPGHYEGGVPYPYSHQWAVEQAFTFASTAVKLWDYAKEHKADVYFNPHPQLCDLVEHARENEAHPEGPNAHIIGLEGVRKWIVNRFDCCLAYAQEFTDIQKPVEG